MEPWPQFAEPEIIHKGWRTIVRKRFIQPDGTEVVHETEGELNAHNCAVIALDSNNKAIMAYQFRPGPELYMHELPGGGIKPGEDAEAGALRELREETGYEAGSVEFLGAIHGDAYQNGMWFFYLATNCVKVSGQSLDENEFVEVRYLTIQELIDAAKTGKMTNPQAVLMAYEKLMKLQEEMQ